MVAELCRAARRACVPALVSTGLRPPEVHADEAASGAMARDLVALVAQGADGVVLGVEAPAATIRRVQALLAVAPRPPGEMRADVILATAHHLFDEQAEVLNGCRGTSAMISAMTACPIGPGSVRLKPDEDDATMVATFAVEKAGKLPPGLGLLRIEPDSIQVLYEGR